MTGHVGFYGMTQGGKSYAANFMHQRWDSGLSAFINTNENRVWGARCVRVEDFAAAAASGSVNYIPPRGRPEARSEHLASLVDTVFEWAKRGGHQNGGAPWCQLIIDEVHRYDPEVIEDVVTRGLGAYGVRVVLITQYPTQMPTAIRTNLFARVCFAQQTEGERFMVERWGATEEVLEHTRKKWHYATLTNGKGWTLHPPL